MAYVAIENGDLGHTARDIINGIGTGLDDHTTATGSPVHSLRTMAMQSASAVAITGGTITAGISSSAVAITGGTINNTRVTVTSVAVDTTLNADHMIVLVSGSPTISLPTAVGISGRIYHVKNVGVKAITIIASGSQVIDGETSKTVSSQYSSLQLVSDGSNWNII
jgi:hypothetical protein